jgi:hypothetical protein
MLILSLQRYLARRRLYSPFSMREKSTVVALLSTGYELEDSLNRQCF